MYSSRLCRDRYSMNAMVLLPYSFLFRQRIPALFILLELSQYAISGFPVHVRISQLSILGFLRFP